ncbi:uncharacterized protein LOC121788885 [Salvia splendens]|uniref:uncharacterized protein LOC121788885 n=1 Tax=Salvia splendens TaxID=180675 RepID=UPI001C2813EE|nr:uncharacterized protein LOC121788885 [Salvia splendens]
MSASESRCSVVAAHRQVVVSPLSLSITLDPSIDHLSLALALAVVQAPSATAASPRRSSTTSSQIVAAATPEGVVVANFAGDEIDRIHPHCGTCNYLFLTLLKIGQFGEAVEVLKGMGRARCVPDCDSYRGLIAELSEARKVDAVAEVVKEMM